MKAKNYFKSLPYLSTTQVNLKTKLINQITKQKIYQKISKLILINMYS